VGSACFGCRACNYDLCGACSDATLAKTAFGLDGVVAALEADAYPAPGDWLAVRWTRAGVSGALLAASLVLFFLLHRHFFHPAWLRL
jgi:hypothetical protein